MCSLEWQDARFDAVLDFCHRAEILNIEIEGQSLVEAESVFFNKR